MQIVPPSIDNIKVGYISRTEGYVHDLSIEQANEYERFNPGTTFIFVDGDREINYLTINQVNELSVKDLLRTDACNTDFQPCGPPRINFFDGEGIGAKANPIIDANGVIIAVDVISGGFGYSSPPRVQVIDDCDNGSGAVLQAIVERGVVIEVIVLDGGRGYLQSKQSANFSLGTVPQYLARVCLKRVLITNPGINYNCSIDRLVISPSNGATLSYSCDSFGRITRVDVVSKGCYQELPSIYMERDTGLNASFVPVFEITRDPTEPESPDDTVIKVYDLVGLTLQGYIGGKEYYGNVYFENGLKYAGRRNTGGVVRVYDTKRESISQ